MSPNLLILKIAYGFQDSYRITKANVLSIVFIQRKSLKQVEDIGNVNTGTNSVGFF